MLLEDKPREACGVIGIYSPQESAGRLAYFGLRELQHRGQQAGGIATLDQNRKIQLHKGTGLVHQIFDDEALLKLTGAIAIGHTRYATSGDNSIANAQPFVLNTPYGFWALGHNGNLRNTATLRQALLASGMIDNSEDSSDSRLMTIMLAEKTKELAQLSNTTSASLQIIQCLKAVMPQWKGAYALTLIGHNSLIAVRDPWGFRPLHLGSLPNQGYAIASETGALKSLGCHDLREIGPGEIIVINKEEGLQSFQGQAPRHTLARCTFEHIYFSRPDTVWDSFTVHQVRQRLGELLAQEMQVEADVVIPVPDSAVPAAIAFSQATGIPYNEGLIKNRYMGRTFIQPTDSLRKQGVALKFKALTNNLYDKRVVMIDDSIVRGNTAGPLVKLVRQAGAKAIYLGITCPPIAHPCYMGIDMGTYEELIAHKKNSEQMRQHFGCDQLHFLSLSGVMQALDNHVGYCNACFTGCYPSGLT